MEQYRQASERLIKAGTVLPWEVLTAVLLNPLEFYYLIPLHNFKGQNEISICNLKIAARYPLRLDEAAFKKFLRKLLGAHRKILDTRTEVLEEGYMFVSSGIREAKERLNEFDGILDEISPSPIEERKRIGQEPVYEQKVMSLCVVGSAQKRIAWRTEMMETENPVKLPDRLYLGKINL